MNILSSLLANCSGDEALTLRTELAIVYGKKTQFNSVARFLVFASGRDDVFSYESMRFSLFFFFLPSFLSLYLSFFSFPEESVIIGTGTQEK